MHKIKLILFLAFIMLIPISVQGNFHSLVALTHNPGEFYFIKNLWSPDNIFAPFALFHTTDYGATEEQVVDTANVVAWHQATNTYWFGHRRNLYKTASNFRTSLLIGSERAVGWLEASTVLQDYTDSLIFCWWALSWSFDTLQTSESSTFGGIYGEYAVDWFQGWNGSEMYMVTTQNDSVFYNVSTDFGQSFSLTHMNYNFGADGKYHSGNQSGEIYYHDWITQTFWSSVDTGRTWQEGAIFDQHNSYLVNWQISFYRGWHPGEMICHWMDISYSPTRASVTDLYLTQDYGMTWTLMNDTNVEEQEYSSIPISQTISVWPNPTNSSINIRGSEQINNINIYDILGRLVLTEKFTPSDVKQLNLHDLQTGTYFLKTDLNTKAQKITLIK